MNYKAFIQQRVDQHTRAYRSYKYYTWKQVIKQGAVKQQNKATKNTTGRKAHCKDEENGLEVHRMGTGVPIARTQDIKTQQPTTGGQLRPPNNVNREHKFSTTI